jgi:hypothetical protein
MGSHTSDERGERTVGEARRGLKQPLLVRVALQERVARRTRDLRRRVLARFAGVAEDQRRPAGGVLSHDSVQALGQVLVCGQTQQAHARVRHRG